MKEWIERSDYPIKRFFNTSGKLYRELGLKDKVDNMDLDGIAEILSTDGMLVKRPVLIGENIILVGFKEEEWKEIL